MKIFNVIDSYCNIDGRKRMISIKFVIQNPRHDENKKCN